MEQFDNHPNWSMLLMDYKKAEEINHVSRESKDLITEMGNTEIWQCPDCASYWNLVSYTAHAENVRSLRKRVDNTTKTDMTHCRFLDTK